MEDTVFLLLFWSGPIGIGIFLVLLGTFIWLLSKAVETKKRTKAMMKEKGIEGK
jgi:membrane protein implicated in regulation of membrane protease activity